MGAQKVKIIAGPCSIDLQNKAEVFDMLNIKISGKSALFGVRVVGLKSRTNFDPKNAFIGIDLESYEANVAKLMRGDFGIITCPSVEIANEIQSKNPEIFIATEVVDPWVQCSVLADFLKSSKAIVWNPAVNHLGFPIQIMAKFAKENGWKVGIKNGKALGAPVAISESKNAETPLDKSWSGLSTYASNLEKSDIYMIHRGVDSEDNMGFRNYPIHNMCIRVKQKTGNPMFLDPSHIAGPKKRSEIVDFTIDAMKIKCGDDFLYDGILLECGTSKSDTDQHITIAELEQIIVKLSEFRQI
ncbi:hypothetical protein [Candidatus Deianiraea vastatrix]|uniref:3-deoxy-7-phosphoheptulonate synthase n=1 Tax=Candidatus Deianiraea vastatrix TaxID=2163644 RepID=A0A5B8XCX5_9RICK|nr:hypothetical protein [Candidatus Deianiraea vastatrix]QED23229.1 Putative 3-deoxy-7-phosphoheptulonate synthase [Candidatus Deianiraea vastatrix]